MRHLLIAQAVENLAERIPVITTKDAREFTPLRRANRLARP